MSISSQHYEHWKIQLEPQENNHKILWVYFDKKEANVNSINQDVLHELESIIDKARDISGLIIASKKKQGFIAGADLMYLSSLREIPALMDFMRLGQRIFDKLANMPIPTVALIDGFCLGGGLELSLACRYRIAEDSEKTKLGLPEVLLGIHPGWGGTVRLPRLIRTQSALNLLMSGRSISGKAAAKIGLVDLAVPKRHLVTAAMDFIKKAPHERKVSAVDKVMNTAIARTSMAFIARRQLRAKVNQAHYPAPYAILKNWEDHGAEPMTKALEHEVLSVQGLLEHPTAKNLLRVFLLQDTLKSSAKKQENPIKRVHVIGAGTMGGDIAAWCALRGFEVTLQDRDTKFISPAIKRAGILFAKKCKRAMDARLAMDRLMVDIDGHGIANADVIIEAVFEDLKIKQELFALIEQKAKPTALLATNTSSFPLAQIGHLMHHPERLVGIHFFNPVSQMQLVEVVKGEKTQQDNYQQAINFVKSLDKLPLGVNSTPGFLVNRALLPYLMESLLMVEEGIPLEVIDAAALNFGMPMGPIELSDTIGLDVCLLVAEHLNAHNPMEIPKKLQQLIADKKLGRKTGCGFYRYEKGKPVKQKKLDYKESTEALADRMILRMLNELAACLREQVIENDDLADAGMIFGTGFAPFLGGPFHYAKTQGIEVIEEKLRQLQARFGDRFAPDPGWNALK